MMISIDPLLIMMNLGALTMGGGPAGCAVVISHDRYFLDRVRGGDEGREGDRKKERRGGGGRPRWICTRMGYFVAQE